MSQRSLQLSELSFQEGETRLEKASRRAIDIEKLNRKIQRTKIDFGKKLQTKNIEKQNKMHEQKIQKDIGRANFQKKV